MKNSLVAFASASAILLGLSTQLAGCACSQETVTDEDGNEKTLTVCEPLTQYQGTEVTQTIAYTAGQGVEINGANGGIDVNVGSGSDISVSFQPKTARAGDEEEEAISEMENDLTLTVRDDGDNILIEATTAEGSNPYLAADIRVTLPSSFAGRADIFNDNGSADVDLGGTAPTSVRLKVDNGALNLRGAAGTLDVSQGNGTECNVSVSAWSTENGTITCDSIDSVIGIPSGANGSIQVQSQTGLITDPSPLPSDWVASEQNVDNSKSFTMGDGMGGNVVITNDGDIALDAN